MKKTFAGLNPDGTAAIYRDEEGNIASATLDTLESSFWEAVNGGKTSTYHDPLLSTDYEGIREGRLALRAKNQGRETPAFKNKPEKQMAASFRFDVV